MEEPEVHFKNCNEDHVFHWTETTIKIEQFSQRLKRIFHSQTPYIKSIVGQLQIPEVNQENLPKWFVEGIGCEILKPGSKGWQKGKVKLHINVTVEFCPDEPEIEEPESPLDDFRHQ